MCFLFYVISGWKSGLVTCLEKELGKQLNMIGCSLHHHELPFKAVFRELNGGTKDLSEGSVPLQFASHKIGPVVGSRWLTLAIRLMALYVHQR